MFGGMASPVKKLTVRLDEDLWRRLKIVLIRNGRTEQAIFSDYAQRYVDHHEKGGTSGS
jgi:hypothetical protein